MLPWLPFGTKFLRVVIFETFEIFFFMTDILAPEVRPRNAAYDEINRAHSKPLARYFSS